jgi:hypothetical protein
VPTFVVYSEAVKLPAFQEAKDDLSIYTWQERIVTNRHYISCLVNIDASDNKV